MQPAQATGCGLWGEGSCGATAAVTGLKKHEQATETVNNHADNNKGLVAVLFPVRNVGLITDFFFNL